MRKCKFILAKFFGVGHQPDVHRPFFLCFGVCVQVRHPPPDPVHGRHDCNIFFVSDVFIRDTIRGGCLPNGQCWTGGGCPKQVSYCQDVFDGWPLSIYLLLLTNLVECQRCTVTNINNDRCKAKRTIILNSPQINNIKKLVARPARSQKAAENKSFEWHLIGQYFLCRHLGYYFSKLLLAELTPSILQRWQLMYCLPTFHKFYFQCSKSKSWRVSYESFGYYRSDSLTSLHTCVLWALDVSCSKPPSRQWLRVRLLEKASRSSLTVKYYFLSRIHSNIKYGSNEKCARSLLARMQH